MTAPMPAAAAPRLLLVAPQWLGDAVMAQQLVARLHARWPQARIDALALPAVGELLRLMPGIDAVVDAPFAHGRLDWTLRRRLAAELRARGYAAAYVLPNSLKAALVPWLAGIGLRIGYLGEQRYGLLNRRLPNPPKGRSRPLMREHYARLAEFGPSGAVSGTGAPPVAGTPWLRAPDDAAAQRRALLGALAEAPYLALAPGAEYGPAKRWPAAHYAALARLAQAAGLAVVIVGGPKDREAGEQIATAAGLDLSRLAELCGRTRVAQAVALLDGAAALVSNDSGLMHIGAALGRPTLGIYGSTDPAHTPPAPLRAATIWLGPQGGVDCSPCFARVCPLGHLRCLHELRPEAVWQRLQALAAPLR
jgi:heptosyltransferase-2